MTTINPQTLKRIFLAYMGCRFSFPGVELHHKSTGLIESEEDGFRIYPDTISVAFWDYDFMNGVNFHLRPLSDITDNEFRHFVTVCFATQVKYYRQPSTSFRVDRYTNTIKMHIGTKHVGDKATHEVFVVMCDFITVFIEFVNIATGVCEAAPAQSIREYRDFFRPNFDMGFGNESSLAAYEGINVIPTKLYNDGE